MKKPNLETHSDEEFDCWLAHTDTKWKYSIFVALGDIEPLSDRIIPIIKWCGDMFGGHENVFGGYNIKEKLDKGETPPTWTWCSLKVSDASGISFLFQHEDDAFMFILTWKHYNPKVLQWVNN